MNPLQTVDREPILVHRPGSVVMTELGRDGCLMSQTEQHLEQPEKQPSRLGGATGAGFMPGQSGNPRGRQSLIERARLEEAERKALVAELVDGFTRRLGREPFADELLALNTITRLELEARRLASKGKSTGRQDDRIGRMLRQVGLSAGASRAVKATNARPRSLSPVEERLARARAEATERAAGERTSDATVPEGE
jgi:hypothetical protein